MSRAPSCPAGEGAPGGVDPRRRRLLEFVGLAPLAWIETLLPAGAEAGSAQAALDPGSDSLRLDIRAGGARQAIRSDYAGLSYEKAHLANGLFTAANASLIAFFRLLGPGLLRIGGNSVDRTRWEAVGGPARADRVTPLQIEGLADFLGQCGWQVIYGLNLATSSPEERAAEADAACSILGSALYGLEVGNECDLYRYNGLRPAHYRYDDFLAEWRATRASILARRRGAAFTGPATSFDVPGYAVPFARDAGRDVRLLTHHYYRADGLDARSTIDLMLSRDATLAPAVVALADAARDAGVADGMRLAEANSFYHEGSVGVSDSFASALWALDFMLASATQGCAGVNLHGGGLTKSYTPLADDGRRVIGVRPEFYALYAVSRIARGSLVECVLEPALPTFSAYAVLAPEGGLALVLLNRHEERDARVEVNAPADFRNMRISHLTGAALATHDDVAWDGRSLDTDGLWRNGAPRANVIQITGNPLLRVPAHSAVLVHLD